MKDSCFVCMCESSHLGLMPGMLLRTDVWDWCVCACVNRWWETQDDSDNVWLPVRLARLSNYGLYGWKWGGFVTYVILWLQLLCLVKLWEVNAGHWDSYVLFDLQLSARVHLQVRSAEEVEVKRWLVRSRRRRRKKDIFRHIFFNYTMCIYMTSCTPCVSSFLCVCLDV